MSLTFPFPVSLSFIVTASFALTLSELMEAFMVKLPTAPENEAGLPAGNGFTVTEAGEDVITFLTS